jgi:hypothetical protein
MGGDKLVIIRATRTALCASREKERDGDGDHSLI